MCVLKICLYCEKEFEADKNVRQYCSRKCGGLGRRSKGGPCDICGVKHSRKRPTGLEAWYKHPKSGKVICDSCYGKIPRKRLCVECGNTHSTRWHSNEKGTICHKCAEGTRRVKVKIDVFTHYCNGKPICCVKGCNVDDVDMLALDHVNNDGTSHRKEIGVKTGSHMYDWVVKNNYPKLFQVMCWNHNIKKQLNRIRKYS